MNRKEWGSGHRIAEYESAAETKLLRRVPVIVRIQSRDISTAGDVTDRAIIACMESVGMDLAIKIAGCKMLYQQLRTFDMLILDDENAQCYSDYTKFVTSVASLATSLFAASINEVKKLTRFPTFDVRCFNVPEFDVNGYFNWRQTQAYYAGLHEMALKHKISGGSNEHVQQALLELGIDWQRELRVEKSGVLFERTIDKSKLPARRIWTARLAPSFELYDIMRNLSNRSLT